MAEPRPIGIGSRIAFVANFLGRRLAYVFQVVEYVPGKRFVMRTADGPFPMATTYEWQPTKISPPWSWCSKRLDLRHGCDDGEADRDDGVECDR